MAQTPRQVFFGAGGVDDAHKPDKSEIVDYLEGREASLDAEAAARAAAVQAVAGTAELALTIAQVGAKAPVAVRAIVTTNVNIANGLENGDTVGGLVLATGDLVVLAGQTTAAQNGVYTAPASGAASRASGFTTGPQLYRAAFFAAEGVNAGKVFAVRNEAAPAVGADAIVITQAYELPGIDGLDMALAARTVTRSGLVTGAGDNLGGNLVFAVEAAGEGDITPDSSEEGKAVTPKALAPRLAGIKALIDSGGDAWSLQDVDHQHARLRLGIRNDEIWLPGLGLRREGNEVSLRCGEANAFTAIAAEGGVGFDGFVDRHNRWLLGIAASGAVYPAPGGAAPAGESPVLLNVGAMRHLERFRGRWLRGDVARKLYVGIIGDSFVRAGYRWLRGGAYQGLYRAYGDGGAGWVSFVTGNIRSQGHEYPLTGAGDSSTPDWLVQRRNAGNVSPDISSVTPLVDGAALTLNAPVDSAPVSGCDLYFNAAAACTLRYRWNGGSWTNLVLATSGGPAKVALGGLPGASGWTLDLESVSGATELYGLFLDSSASGINLSALAVAGAKAFDWINNDAASWKQAVALTPITSWFIMLGTNDQLDRSPAQFIANMDVIVTRLREVRPGADVCFLVPPDNFDPNRHGVTPMADYEAAVRAYCAQRPTVAALIMQRSVGLPGGDYRSDGAFASWDADDIHPNVSTGGYAMSAFFLRHIFNL